jgi:hypothetical protein
VAGEEADHSCLSSAKIKNEWGYTSTPTDAFMVCVAVTLFIKLSLYRCI